MNKYELQFTWLFELIAVESTTDPGNKEVNENFLFHKSFETKSKITLKHHTTF